ncbi:hypothetical protein L249_5823 [Ophiocordyceps polyrhachis-furcata BCC 54312]|uniref:Uncharacterized protein n=1 Tax=Ophiocordyceps polyrhachis-furcata BCC 54312 TaxID=1330021 RepID=A0A367L0A7_9HYPO|nr:hypothetical protein L249_5823 [Ophiocordyceps polyrhachis-furcata BCC 54312]
MPRFSFAFSRRKPSADDFENVHITTTAEQPSFRVFERPDTSNRSFDGGARLARVPRTALPRPDLPRPNLVELDADDNMFADLKVNRGSGLSNTTKATSTDNSSRYSNASTAPSSADLAGHESQPPPRESPSRTESKSNSFLDRATRTFSFGVQKKHTVPPPKESIVPDLPPVLSLSGDTSTTTTTTTTTTTSSENRSRGLTCSTDSTATPTQPHPAAGINLGGDFSSILTSFEEKQPNDAIDPRFPAGIRQVSALDPGVAIVSPARGGLSHQSHENKPSTFSTQQRLGSRYPEPDPVSRQQVLGSRYPEPEPPKKVVVVDEDAKFLQESLAAINLFSDPHASASSPAQAHRYRRDEDTFHATPTKTVAPKEDNIFEGSLSRASRVSHRYVPRTTYQHNKNKVMTPAEFEKYRQDKEKQGSKQQAATEAVKEDEDDINYEDDEDELEQSKQQAKQRRKQEAHMAVYRQQMMKVTGESAASPPVQRNPRAGLPPSSSAPQLSTKSVSGVEDEDEDEDVPLGILQAHGFPARNRPPTRLAHSGSSTNLRSSPQGPPAGRPASITGEAPSNAARRQSVLPAFARNLPQDPFVGASIARPALRESLSFGDAGQFAQLQQQQQQGPLPPGGLVGVIASEERSRALRRGSPSVDNMKLPMGMGPSGPHAPGLDPVGGIPPHMMYGPGSMPGMASMPPPQPPAMMPGDQAQLHMTQQMQQFMQMQMHMMHMMAANQGGGGGAGGHPMQPQMQPPYGGGLPSSMSVADLSSRHSVISDPARAMSMLHGNTPFLQQPPQDGYLSAAGYAPSIAPSERSNIGLPGRYRPVSQMPPGPSMPAVAQGHQRSATMSGRLSSWGDDKSRSTVRVVDRAGEGSDEDDEQGWAAMKALRERKKSMWKTKKSYGSELAL